MDSLREMGSDRVLSFLWIWIPYGKIIVGQSIPSTRIGVNFMCVNADNQRFEVVFLDGLTVAYEAISVSKSYKMIQSSIFFLVCDIIAWNYFLIIRWL